MKGDYKKRLSEPYRKILFTRLPEALDRRRKIPTEEHDYIRKRHKEGEAIRAIARSYNVDKRLIQFIIFPERLEVQRKRKHEQKYSQKYYHDKVKGKKWADIMREHRHYKKELFKNGVLKVKE